MNLSDLILYRNQLNRMHPDSVKSQTKLELDKITHSFEIQPSTLFDESAIDTLRQKQLAIENALDDYNAQVNALKVTLKHQIEQDEHPWFQESYRLFEEEMIYEPTDYILNRALTLSEESKDYLKSRVKLYNTWQAPGLIIRPGNEEFVDIMVSHDPLYLVDKNYELLDPAVNKFTSVYKSRLRKYTIDERAENHVFDKLPDEQFGICLAYAYFNFRPFEIIKQYFTEIYQKLKPGGVFLFTFNDCDREHGVRLVERHFACYTPGYLVTELATSIGFEVEFSWHDGGPSTWLELRKPGTFESLKGGQTLAKIIPK